MTRTNACDRAKTRMDEPEICYRPIGWIHTPFVDIAGMPIQPAGALGVRGTVELLAEFGAGLQGLEGFSHIILVYHFHRARGWSAVVTPFLDSEPHGVFATRAPKRPNPIGISVVELRQIEGTTLHVVNVDILDGTPLLDVKPYVPEFDQYPAERIGWLEKAKASARNQTSDERFR
jgi:tRNA-Thr(GGU) m(6)t(6)A37 methyltransferase TsaA